MAVAEVRVDDKALTRTTKKKKKNPGSKHINHWKEVCKGKDREGVGGVRGQGRVGLVGGVRGQGQVGLGDITR